MSTTTTRHPAADALEAWARDTGTPFVTMSGIVDGRAWEYATVERTCATCGRPIAIGRCSMSGGTYRLADGPTWHHPACVELGGYVSTHGAYAVNCRKATKLPGDLALQPGAKGAATQLGKLEPAAASRFRIIPTDAVTLPDGALGELATAGRHYAARAAVAGDAPAPAAKPRRPRAVAPAAPEAAPVVEPAVVVEEPAPPVAPVVEPVAASLPASIVEWLDRLVFADKRAYAHAWAEHVVCGADAPADPGTDWAAKARSRCARVLAHA